MRCFSGLQQFIDTMLHRAAKATNLLTTVDEYSKAPSNLELSLILTLALTLTLTLPQGSVQPEFLLPRQ